VEWRDCIFCSIVSGESSAWVVGESKGALGILDINPVTPGHTLVLPKRHAQDIWAVSAEDFTAVADLTRSLAASLVRSVSNSGASSAPARATPPDASVGSSLRATTATSAPPDQARLLASAAVRKQPAPSCRCVRAGEAHGPFPPCEVLPRHVVHVGAFPCFWEALAAATGDRRPRRW